MRWLLFLFSMTLVAACEQSAEEPRVTDNPAEPEIHYDAENCQDIGCEDTGKCAEPGACLLCLVLHFNLSTLLL